MAMRLSGLMSGMDTESIIQQLVEAKGTKVKAAKGTKTKLEWKQDIWKDLNSKLKTLQSKLNELRFSGGYAKKITKASNESAVSVMTSDSAITGTQELEITQIAKTANMTGGVLQYKPGISGGAIDGETILGNLMDFEDGETKALKVTVGSGSDAKTTGIKLTAKTTIAELTNQLKNAGLNVNFDEKQKRFYISSKTSGSTGTFSFRAAAMDIDADHNKVIWNDAPDNGVLSALGLSVTDTALRLKPGATGAIDENTTVGSLMNFAGGEEKALKVKIGSGSSAKTLDIELTADMKISDVVQKLNEKAQGAGFGEAQFKAAFNAVDGSFRISGSQPVAFQSARVRYNKSIVDAADNGVRGALGLPATQSDTGSALSLKPDATGALDGNTTLSSLAGIDFAAGEEKALRVTIGSGSDAKTIDLELTADMKIDDVVRQLNEKAQKVGFSEAQFKAEFDAANGSLKISGDQPFEFKSAEVVYDKSIDDAADNGVLGSLGLAAGRAASVIAGQDAVIKLNGVEYTNTHNSFEINGLTITAQKATAPGETISLNTSQDTDGIYNKIKDFLKTYNEIINEIDKLYGAETAKGYEPLTDEEKSSMSEKEVEKYEQKIKDALMRRDSNLSSIGSELKRIMSAGYSVPGQAKEMVLASFGIETLGYFNSKDNEKNAYHILGDPDDGDVSAKTDKLKSMISSDPEAVISFFSQLSQKLYSKMNEMSAPVEGYRSFGSFYDDKKMKDDLKGYESKVKDLEKKLTAYEDRWYAKFADMETAMAKMQQNASAVTSLLGGGG